jgi:hypothetical protein
MKSTSQAHGKTNKKPGTLSKELWSSIPYPLHRTLKNISDSLEKIHWVLCSNEAPNSPTLLCYGGTCPGNKSKGMPNSHRFQSGANDT